MGNANVAVNTWLSSKERFADLFNGVLFGGRRVILPEELENVDRETDLLVTDKTGRRRALQRYRDTAMAWKREVILAILTCESQNKIHYAMPVREMMNDSLTYADQIRELWRKYERKERLQKEQKENTKVTRVRKDRHLTAEEYLSRFRKDDRLFPVISLVFYFDQKQWDGAKDIRDNRAFFGNVDVETYQALREFLHSEKILKDTGKAVKETKIDMRKNGMSDEDIRKYTGVSEAEMAAKG